MPSGHFMLYHTARTEHLKRLAYLQAHSSTQRQLLYRSRSYDWDDEVATFVGAQQAGVLRTALLLLAKCPSVVEINEPAFLKGAPSTLVYIACTRLSDMLRSLRRGSKPKTLLVSYAIENVDPGKSLEAKARRLLKYRFETVPFARYAGRAATRTILRNIDRLAVGTSDSLAMYDSLIPLSSLSRLSVNEIIHLPSPCTCGELSGKEHQLIFVGEFSSRKGIITMLKLWSELDEINTGVPLDFVLIGKGLLQSQVEDWAAMRPRATVFVDPPRKVIHEQLRKSTALFLLSQSDDHWREQVGLPILEGLAHGCLVVSTDQTGIAPWLRSHGHVILTAGTSLANSAPNLLRVIESSAAPHPSFHDLPAADTRLDADRWLHSVEIPTLHSPN